jgi:hypothetical protein
MPGVVVAFLVWASSARRGLTCRGEQGAPGVVAAAGGGYGRPGRQVAQNWIVAVQILLRAASLVVHHRRVTFDVKGGLRPAA